MESEQRRFKLPRGSGCLLLLIVMFLAPPLGCLWIDSQEFRGRMPAKLADSELIASRSAIGGFLEGCLFGLYRLPPESVAALQRQGRLFLGDAPHPAKEHERNPYGTWRMTPVVVDRHGGPPGTRRGEYFQALGASNGCVSSGTAKEAQGIDVEAELARPGNYFSITENLEGLILIMPTRGLALFLYYG